MNIKNYVLTVLLALLITSVAAAQDDCPTLERAAFAEARVWCVSLISDSACYGNPLAAAEATAELPFNKSGDLLPLQSVNALSTATGENQFGVVLMQSSTFAADDWTPVELRWVLLGEAQINDSSPTFAPQIATIDAEQGANLRTDATEDAGLIATLPLNTNVHLLALSQGGDWVQVLLRDGRVGWVVAAAVDADVSDLPPSSTVDTASYTPYGMPFTQVMLTTGRDDARCDAAPESGAMVQVMSPDVTTALNMNGTDIIFDGTLYVQAVADALTLHVIEGEATVSAAEQTVMASSGQAVNVSFTENEDGETVIGAMSEPASYDFARVDDLPVELLARAIYVGIDLTQIITPRPAEDVSPIADVLVTEPCRITTGETGANLRGGPGTEFPIRGVMAFRESAAPVGRAVGTDGGNWWMLARNVWVSAATTVTGGDCIAVPQVTRVPVPPQETDE